MTIGECNIGDCVEINRRPWFVVGREGGCTVVITIMNDLSLWDRVYKNSVQCEIICPARPAPPSTKMTEHKADCNGAVKELVSTLEDLVDYLYCENADIGCKPQQRKCGPCRSRDRAMELIERYRQNGLDKKGNT